MKKYIKWIAYYASVVIIIALVALFFPSALRLNYHSLEPVLYMVVWIAIRIIYQYKWNFISVLEGNETEWFSAYELKLVFAVLPIFLPFVFFFSNGIKACSGLIIPIAYFGFIAYLVNRSNKAEKEHRDIIEKELEEQKKREELGRWK